MLIEAIFIMVVIKPLFNLQSLLLFRPKNRQLIMPIYVRIFCEIWIFCGFYYKEDFLTHEFEKTL